MLTKKFVVENEVGLHARPASLFVETANKFKSSVFVKKDGTVVNAKSILGILSLGAEKGAELEVAVDGEDEEAALKAIQQLMQTKFGEE
ncbi:HPr family phosphocarrier protein [Coprothermobacter platensis]|uniref:HPr family phosphocarrier protein n=1 Tax=Coprothermobacter platensis TaxID=108819 RepID=UPI00036CC58B|nr:HPr family phosphocarrier protein [Coprothermobacter platensis]